MNYFIWSIFFFFVIQLPNVDCGSGSRTRRGNGYVRLRRSSQDGNDGKTTSKTEPRKNDHVITRKVDSSGLDEEIGTLIRDLRQCDIGGFEDILNRLNAKFDGLFQTCRSPRKM